MKIERQKQFISNIKTLSLHQLRLCYDWLKVKDSEIDREDKLRLMSLEIKRKERLKRNNEELKENNN